MNNLDDLDAALAALANSLSGEALTAATKAAAAPILAQAIARAPVRRGDIRDNLGTVTSHAGAHASTSVEVAHSGQGGVAREALFIEYGTEHMTARPFMRPAAAVGANAALAAFTSTLQGQIQDFA